MSLLSAWSISLDSTFKEPRNRFIGKDGQMCNEKILYQFQIAE